MTPQPALTPSKRASRRILAIDIGGSGLKASVLDAAGAMLSERVRVPTPHPCTRAALLRELAQLAATLPESDCVAVGFPGVVRHGRIITAPNLGTDHLRGFDIAGALAKRLAKPVRVLNDADMQGLAAIAGRGVEMVVTLGTGFGTSLFVDGRIGPHLELAHHPFRKGDTYDEQLGDRARREVGDKRWGKRVARAIALLRVLTNFDRLYIGGGNAKKLSLELPPDVTVVPNEYGIKGGAFVWRD